MHVKGLDILGTQILKPLSPFTWPVVRPGGGGKASQKNGPSPSWPEKAYVPLSSPGPLGP